MGKKGGKHVIFLFFNLSQASTQASERVNGTWNGVEEPLAEELQALMAVRAVERLKHRLVPRGVGV